MKKIGIAIKPTISGNFQPLIVNEGDWVLKIHDIRPALLHVPAMATDRDKVATMLFYDEEGCYIVMARTITNNELSNISGWIYIPNDVIISPQEVGLLISQVWHLISKSELPEQKTLDLFFKHKKFPVAEDIPLYEASPRNGKFAKIRLDANDIALLVSEYRWQPEFKEYENILLETEDGEVTDADDLSALPMNQTGPLEEWNNRTPWIHPKNQRRPMQGRPAPQPAPQPVQPVQTAPQPVQPVQTAPQPIQPEPQPAPQPVQPEPQPAPQPVQPEPQPAPQPVPPEPQPAPQPVPPEPQPAPEPVQPEPQPAPQPVQPEPLAEESAPVEPQHQPSPQPKRKQKPKPKPKPQPVKPEPEEYIPVEETVEETGYNTETVPLSEAPGSSGMKKYLIIAIVVVALAVVGYFLFSTNNPFGNHANKELVAKDNITEAVNYLDNNDVWTEEAMNANPELKGLYNELNTFHFFPITGEWKRKLKASTRFQEVAKAADKCSRHKWPAKENSPGGVFSTDGKIVVSDYIAWLDKDCKNAPKPAVDKKEEAQPEVKKESAPEPAKEATESVQKSSKTQKEATKETPKKTEKAEAATAPAKKPEAPVTRPAAPKPNPEPAKNSSSTRRGSIE